ncbi:MAG: B12-binding domain-containing radical SAM protein [Candidatus Thorarchaeota archaeon]
MPYEAFTEQNVIFKDISKIDVLFGFCYPSTYRAGMSGLATHLFYAILNGRSDTSCERYFRYDTRSPVNSVETGRPLHDNHLLGFSLTYEEDILGLVQMLEMGKVHVLASERSNEDPIVIVGGPAVSANPEPYVDFVDAFVIGEGDLVIHDIIDATITSGSRREVLEKLAGVRGLYVPSLPQASVSRLIIPSLEALFHPTAQVFANVEEQSKHETVFGRSLLVEVSRGCGHSCKFCLVGHICRPRRVRSLGRLMEIIEEGVEQSSVSKIALIASSLGDLDQLEELAEWVIGKKLGLSTPSLRADRVTLRLLQLLKEGGQRTLTIAPETGSASLRRSMGKGLDDDEIYNAVSYAKDAGLSSVKAYFIIGLPGETDDDVRAIATMTSRFAKESGLRVTANVNPFIPKAHTRWEREPQPPLEVLRSRIKLLEKELHNVPRTSLETLDPRSARIQAALSIGDRSIGKVIKVAATQGGFGAWRRAEKETKIEFLGRASDGNHLLGKLPWHFIK